MIAGEIGAAWAAALDQHRITTDDADAIWRAAYRGLEEYHAA